jgi:hypothetical protein
LTIAFTNTDEWATAVGGSLLVYAGRPQNPSVNFFKGPYRFAGRINGAVVPPTSPLTVPAPFVFQQTQREHVQFRAVGADARISATQRDSIIAVA